MSVHKKPNGTWFVQYRIPGERTPRREYFPKGPLGERQARIRDAEIKLDKTRGQEPVVAPGKTYLDTVAQIYVVERKTRGASQRWLHDFALLMNNYVLPGLSHAPLDAITYADVIAFVDKTWGHRKLATRQRYLGYLKALFRFAVEHGHTTNNPLAKWRKTKEPQRDMRLTLPDLGKIMKHAAPHLQWAIEIEWELGTRPGVTELFAIRWTDVDFEQCRVHVKGTKTHDANRLVPITPQFRDRLLQMRAERKGEYLIEYKGHAITRVNKGLARAAQRAGIPYPVRMYDIRHLFASTMLANGADLAAVSKILGHSNITTTQKHYYHVLKGEMNRAIRTRPPISTSE